MTGRVTEVVARQVGMEAASLDVHRPLALYGLDSVSTVELVAALEREFDTRLPEWLIGEHPTIAAVAAMIEGGSRRDTTLADDAGRLARDARLPADVRPRFSPPGGLAPAGPGAGPGRVLLTGATGFVGAFVLRELIDTSEDVITCVVRGAPGAVAGRVRRALDRHGLWTPGMASRLRVIPGDVTWPGLGLPPDDRARLAGEIDTIVHAAADVNWVLPYAALHGANVAGTLEVLRLACDGRATQVRFVSSQLAAFVPGGAGEVHESDLPLAHAARLPLGYAQSKLVAEALVREAGARGLRVATYRPGLIAGDARTGASNPDDFVGALIKGCLELGAAPDLDWTVDAVPVDHVARSIVRLGPGDAPSCFHLTNDRPRHWRECVLWMNLYGYACPLLLYDEWLRRLDHDSRNPDHALHRLRAFFLRRGADGLTTPEHYEDSRRAVVRADRTRAALAAAGVACPPLSAALLERYFDDYVQRGFLPPPPRPRARGTHRPDRTGLARRLQAVLRRETSDPTLVVGDVSAMGRGDEHSIIGELTSWRRGLDTGLRHCRVTLGRGGATTGLDVIVKRKPSDEDVLDVGETVAGLCDPALARAWRAARDLVGVRGGHLRELAIYNLAPPAARRFMPHCHGTWRDDAASDWGLVLERLTDVVLIDAVDDIGGWTRPRLEAAVDGLAGLHAAWAPHVDGLRGRLHLDERRPRASAADLAPIRAALARHAAPFHEAWADAALVRRHNQLVREAGDWWPPRTDGVRTLVHGDCNPRNLALRRDAGAGRLCAYDWELAAVGAPQRDLAELLCFVLPPDVPADGPLALADRHRAGLEAVLGPIDRDAWRRGLRDALAEVLVDRLATYTLIHRVRPQAFLPRVARTWARLFEVLVPNA